MITEPRFQQIADMVKHAERGRFFCVDCRANLTDLIYHLPQHGVDCVINCPRCKKQLKVDPVMLSFALITQTRKHLLMPHDTLTTEKPSEPEPVQEEKPKDQILHVTPAVASTGAG